MAQATNQRTKISELIIQKYQVSKGTDLTLDDDFLGEAPESFGSSDRKDTINEPHIPAKVKMRPYQIDAINSWAANNYRGIFDMATGTGKTYTALAAVATLYKATKQNLAVFIVCPYQHLVEQWKDDIVAFGMKPIVCYSASAQKNWKERLKTAATSFNLGVQNHFCVVTTNATFSGDYVQSIVKKMRGNVVLVVDEAHNFGAENLSTTLMDNMKYRLALSATIDRHGDPEGTRKLYDYFGEKCIEYTLKDAIDNKMLTPYYYHPVVVSLSETELEEYLDITAKIRKNVHADKNGKVILSEYAKTLLIKRARLVSGAVEKIDVLRDLMQNYKDDNHMLVYCGATTMHDVDYVPPESIGNTVRHYREKLNSFSRNADHTYDSLTSRYQEIYRSKARIQEWDDELTDISVQIKGKENMKQYEVELTDVKKRLRDLNDKKERLIRDDATLKNDIERYKKVYDSLVAVSGKNKETMLFIQYAEEILDWLSTTYKEKEAFIRDALETKVNHIFEQMYHGHRRVSIDQRYQVTLLTTIEDKEVAAGESEGSNRVKSFAFIAGLVALAKEKLIANAGEEGFNLSSEPYPLVMDAPFSNADETHTANISKVLPEIAEQVIMFVMQKDWRYAEPVMASRVGKQYTLKKQSETYTILE